ncbi:SDR family oxidoreductase [Corynebacterium propinquum]
MRAVIDELTEATPLGRIAHPDDVADAIFSLLRTDNRWVSGDVLNVSGGLFSSSVISLMERDTGLVPCRWA